MNELEKIMKKVEQVEASIEEIKEYMNCLPEEEEEMDYDGYPITDSEHEKIMQDYCNLLAQLDDLYERYDECKANQETNQQEKQIMTPTEQAMDRVLVIEGILQSMEEERDYMQGIGMTEAQYKSFLLTYNSLVNEELKLFKKNPDLKATLKKVKLKTKKNPNKAIMAKAREAYAKAVQLADYLADVPEDITWDEEQSLAEEHNFLWDEVERLYDLAYENI